MFFESTSQPQNIRYELRLDYNFRRDNANEVPFQSAGEQTRLLIDNVPSDIFRVRAAYYDIATETELQQRGKLYNVLDATVIAGFNYFINRSFFIGIRGELGLLDKTNSGIDFSRIDRSPAGFRIERDDNDISQNISVSFGFRF